MLTAPAVLYFMGFCGVLLASRSFPLPCFGWACRWLLDTFNWFCFRVCGVSTWWGGLRGAVLALLWLFTPRGFSVRQLALFCLQCTLFLWTLVCSFVLDAASWRLCKLISIACVLQSREPIRSTL